MSDDAGRCLTVPDLVGLLDLLQADVAIPVALIQAAMGWSRATTYRKLGALREYGFQLDVLRSGVVLLSLPEWLRRVAL